MNRFVPLYITYVIIISLIRAGDILFDSYVTVIGAGLAGVEASYQLAKRGFSVKLYEMKKLHKNPAQQSDAFAELVCSNSLRSDALENAVGLLKTELRMLDSLVIRIADANRIPAGTSLTVDRICFSAQLTDIIRHHPLIEVIDAEMDTIPDGEVIIATGPLTSEPLFAAIKKLTGEDTLYFFDAAAPIILADSIDMTIVYQKSRYDKGEASYLNCPMTIDEYNNWYDELINAQCVIPKDYELKVFEGCMPFEEMAKRGKETLLYGPMKPVGLEMPNGNRPYAVVQLRRDDISGSLYNIVGFQTHLTFPEQQRIIKMIPGLANAKIVRYGVMHKNTFINAPMIINACYQMKAEPRIFIAGQLSGVEGYVESVGSGMVAALNMVKRLQNEPKLIFPRETALGAHAYYLANAVPSFFQPMNINHGLFPELIGKHHKRDRKILYAKRSIETIKNMTEAHLFD